MHRTRGRCLAVLIALLLPPLAGLALAGPPPASCTCPLASDRVVFGDADPAYAITAFITSCNACTDLGGGEVFADMNLGVTFGPYDPAIALCAPGSDTRAFGARLTLANQPAPPGGEAYAIPAPVDAGFLVNVTLNPDLRTACVGPQALDYSISDLQLSGTGGAQAVSFDAQRPPMFLHLPESVRSTDGVVIQFTPVHLTQALDFDYQYLRLAGTPFRYWPEGLPFRLRPGDERYHRDEVVLSTGTTYFPRLPDPTNLPGNEVALTCVAPGGGACTGSGVPSNAGYLDLASWSPYNVRFDTAGFDIDLVLPPGVTTLYAPVFPQRTLVWLVGPATVAIDDGAISGGGFDSGHVTVLMDEVDCGSGTTQQLSYDFLTDPTGPILGADGRLFAGVRYLDEAGPILWARSGVLGPGCGTFYVPPVIADLGPVGNRHGPQHEWLGPESLSTQGRGLYAGINYNRDKICMLGQQAGASFCRTDGDCATGWSCVAPWTPICPDTAPAAIWATDINDQQVVKILDPDGTSAADRTQEMAFYVRASGVTGVFDGGADPAPPVSIGDPAQGSFQLEFNSFGLACLASRSEAADAIMRGTLNSPWPSDTTIPFDQMSVCNCGDLKSAQPPGDVLLENTLGYWHQTFFPQGMDFMTDANAPCASATAQACTGNGSTAAKVCVEALTPVAHFDPEFVSTFGLTPQGQPDALSPNSPLLFTFDAQAGSPPWKFDASNFAFSNWDEAIAPPNDDAGPLKGVVRASGGYGFVDAMGKVKLPYFDLTPAAVEVRRDSPQTVPPPGVPPPLHRVVNLHATHGIGQPGIDTAHNGATSWIAAHRSMATDHVALDYAVDYFQPAALAGGQALDDESGTGLMLGFTRTPLELGAVDVDSGIVLDPVGIRGDVGPTAAVRLWGVTSAAGHAQLGAGVTPPAGGTILPPNPAYVAPPATTGYTQALTKLQQAVGDLGAPDLVTALRTAPDLTDAVHDTGAAVIVKNLPGANAALHVENASGQTVGTGVAADTITGALDFTGTQTLDKVLVDASLSTGGQFFAFRRSRLSVERFVENGQGQAMTTFSRKVIDDAMSLPGQQKIAFPFSEAMSWKFDYDVVPTFKFNSLTGSLDLTQGGFSGVNFDQMGATLNYDADGNWYFEAHLNVEFNGHGVEGVTLLGNTADMAPLKTIDPDVKGFLKGIDAFKGAYIRCGVKTRLIDNGCLLRVSTGAKVGGWYLDGAYGGQVSGWLSGKGACLVSVKGKAKLLGGVVGDLFKLEGSFWVAGGIGFCDEEDWDSPGDAFDDDWCFACVVKTKVTGHYPPKDLDLSWSKPSKDCD